MTTLYRIYMALGITCNLAMTKSTGRVGIGYKQILCHFLKTNFLSTGGFWFLSMVVDSVLCRHQGTVLHKHVPLVESCPLTNPNMVADGRVSSGTSSTSVRLARPQQVTHGTTGIAVLAGGQGSLHLSSPLSQECWLPSLLHS